MGGVDDVALHGTDVYLSLVIGKGRPVHWVDEDLARMVTNVGIRR